jgi:hypothetical protein
VSKGLQAYLLRSPDGHTWIMQAYTDLVDKTLTQAELPNLGKKMERKREYQTDCTAALSSSLWKLRPPPKPEY